MFQINVGRFLKYLGAIDDSIITVIGSAFAGVDSILVGRLF